MSRLVWKFVFQEIEYVVVYNEHYSSSRAQTQNFGQQSFVQCTESEMKNMVTLRVGISTDMNDLIQYDWFPFQDYSKCKLRYLVIY